MKNHIVHLIKQILRLHNISVSEVELSSTEYLFTALDQKIKRRERKKRGGGDEENISSRMAWVGETNNRKLG